MMGVLSNVASFFRDGGPFMFIILGVAVVIAAVVMERMWVIGRASSLRCGKFIRDATQAVYQGNVPLALHTAKQVRTPVGQVAAAVLSARRFTEEDLRAAADASALVALPPLSRRLPYLNMLANSATLLGLLGTIFGLTTAFSAVGAADLSQRSVFLAAGISQALNTTALGLIIAVPTLLLHGFLAAKVDRIAEQVDEAAVALIQALATQTRSAEKAA